MLHRVLGGVGRFLIAAGLIVLLFVAFQLWGTGLETRGHQTTLRKQFTTKVLTSEGKSAAGSEASARQALKSLAGVDPATAAPLAAPAEGRAVGYASQAA